MEKGMDRGVERGTDDVIDKIGCQRCESVEESPTVLAARGGIHSVCAS
jgi:hypothetical protein